MSWRCRSITSGPLSALPEPARTQYEEKYIAAIRLVGSRHLDKGDIPDGLGLLSGDRRNRAGRACDRRLSANGR